MTLCMLTFLVAPLRLLIVQPACHLNKAAWISFTSIFGIKDLPVLEQYSLVIISNLLFFSSFIQPYDFLFKFSAFKKVFDDDLDDRISLF